MESRFFDLDDMRIHVVTHGRRSGSPVVLLHGGVCDHAGISFPKIQQMLPDHIFSIAIDLPGYGKSSRPTTANNNRKFFSKLVTDVCHVLELSKVVVAGLSLGGQVAVGIAIEHPEMVSGLVLIAPGGMVHDQVAPWLPSVFSRIPFVAQGMQYLVRDLSEVDKGLNRMFGNVSALSNETRELLHESIGRKDTFKNFITFMRHEYKNPRQPPEFADRLHCITCPTTVICGERDYFFSAVDLRRAAEAVAGSAFLLVPGAGHWLTIEVPDLVAAEIAQLIEG